MPSNNEAVIEAVESCSEIGVAGLARRLRLDKGTVRKVALEAAKEGRVGARNDGQGYVFFRVGNQAAEPIEQRAPYRADPANLGSQSPQVIDGVFRVLSPTSGSPVASSDSRALVVHGAAQPADSRTEAALKQLAAAKALAGRAAQGHRIAGQLITSLDQLYSADPSGDQTLTALALAEVEAAREKLAKEQEAASRALAAREREPTTGELLSAFGLHAVKVWGAMQGHGYRRGKSGKRGKPRRSV